MEEWEPNDLSSLRDDEKVDKTLREHRIEICKTCNRLSVLKFCKECHCFMPLKTYINSATCPLEKW